MRGHEDLIAMRMAGRKPEIVFINDFPCRTDWLTWGDHATVCVSGDSVVDMDLRFVLGLTVSVAAQTGARASRIAQICKNNGAAVVAYSSIDGPAEIWVKG